MLKRVHRYTAWRIRGIAQVGYAADDYAAEELVQDALNDVATGVVHWDPAAKPLEQHLTDLLKVRTKRLRIHAERFRRVSLDGPRADGEPSPHDELDAVLLDQAPPAATAAYAASVLAELRDRASDDPLVLRMLDAFGDGAATRDDLLHLAGFSPLEYRNARRRLDRLVALLSDPLATQEVDRVTG
jgi:transposase InsO family protein